MDQFKQYPLNAKLSPEDSRDVPVAKLAPVLEVFPKEFRIPYKGVAKNQGEVGSCVAHSLSYTREIQEEKQSGLFTRFSVGFIYGNRRHTDFQESGMYPREALKALKTFGAIPHDRFPYNIEYPEIKNILDPMLDELIDEAIPHRISSYAKVYGLRQLKSALYHIGPVTGCFPIYESFYSVSKHNPVVPNPNRSEEFYGYHEMTILGWTADNHLVVLNSWGPDWGDNGYCLIPATFPIAEMWSISDNILPNEDEEGFFKLVLDKLFKLKDEALQFVKELREESLPAYVVPNGEDFEVHVGFFQSENDIELESMETLLSRIGLTSKVSKG